MRPSFLIFDRSLLFLSGSPPGFEGAASFFFGSRLPSFPSAPALLSPSLAPDSSFALGGSDAFSAGFTWYFAKRSGFCTRASRSRSTRGIELIARRNASSARRANTTTIANGRSIRFSAGVSFCRSART
ncbi:MAG: hypothetical protein E6J82_05315 [Deltaproteobacteria bacterium]|nr:MAG: hypothetical protein E6J82_05315 [Deltaproteobacteria bacterium]